MNLPPIPQNNYEKTIQQLGTHGWKVVSVQKAKAQTTGQIYYLCTSNDLNACFVQEYTPSQPTLEEVNAKTLPRLSSLERIPDHAYVRIADGLLFHVQADGAVVAYKVSAEADTSLVWFSGSFLLALAATAEPGIEKFNQARVQSFNAQNRAKMETISRIINAYETRQREIITYTEIIEAHHEGKAIIPTLKLLEVARTTNQTLDEILTEITQIIK